MKEYMAIVTSGNLRIKTTAVASNLEKARLACLRNARSMYTDNERKAMKPFMIDRIKEIHE